MDAIESLNEIADYVSTSRAAAMLGVTDSHIRRLVLDGDLRAKRWDGHSLMIERASVVAYAAVPRHPGPKGQREKA